jgi:hypothetical protein
MSDEEYKIGLRSAFNSFINDGGTDSEDAAQIFLAKYVRPGASLNYLTTSALAVKRGKDVDLAVTEIMDSIKNANATVQTGGRKIAKRRTANKKRAKKRHTRRLRRERK